MSDEIRYSGRLTVRNGNDFNEIKSGELLADQTTRGSTMPSQLIGTSEEDLVITDITTPGFFYIVNTDPTNYCDLGPKSAGAMVGCMRLHPGVPNGPLFMYPGMTWRAIAHNAPTRLKFLACET